MPNSISTTDKLVSIAAFIQAETPIFDKLSQNVSSDFTAGDSDTIRVELDGYPIITDGATVGADSDIKIEGVDVKIGISATTVSVSTMEKATDIESFDRQVAKPVGVAFAAFAEEKLANTIISNAEHVTVSTGTFAQLSSLQAMIKNTKLGKELMGFLPPSLHTLISQSGVNLFGQSLGKQLYEGEIGKYMKCEYFDSSDMPVVTTGLLPVAGTSKVTTAVTANGATQLIIDGFSSASGTCKRGTVFTLAGVNAVNLLGKEVASPRWFVVQEDATVTTSTATLKVAPLYFKTASGTQDPRCNVSTTTIAQNTLVSVVPQTVNSMYLVGIVFDPKVVAYAAKGLTKFEDQGAASGSMVAGKVPIRMGRSSDMSNGSQKVRFDSLFGFNTILGKGTGLTMTKV